MSRWSLGKTIGRAYQSLNPCRYSNYYNTNSISKRNLLCYYYCGFTGRFNYSSPSSSLLFPSNNYYGKLSSEPLDENRAGRVSTSLDTTNHTLRNVDAEHHEIKCEMYAEAKVGSDSNATQSWKELKKKNIKYQKVTKGDVIDVREFLFTKHRDYLIRYSDKSLVKAEQLAGKVIIIYFVSLWLHFHVRPEEEFNTSVLGDMYNYLSHSNDFEIVFVAINDDSERDSKKRFEDIFSRMPWTAIPFSDVICRRNLAKNFDVNDTTTSFVVDSTGTVLQRDAKFIIQDYGVLGFPFSDERIKLLDAEDDAAVQQPSLITLLGSPQRDYVITNKEEKVPIHTLEGKVVALYFYEDGVCSCKEDNISAYEELARTKENFEVVLIYLTDTPSTYDCTNEESFWKAFKTMPWLALPFKDPNHQKLKRIFEYPKTHDDDHFNEPSLVIFGPRGEFIEPFGNYISEYPFTCENVAKLDTEKVQNLKMEMLWDRNTVFKRIDGSQMKFSRLAGKRVIIFFEINEYQEKEHYFLVKLKERYLQLKGTDDEFEVIHILEYEMDRRLRMLLPIQDLPWLLSLASDLLPGGYDFYESYGHNYDIRSTLLAFDRDGKLVRRTIFPAFKNADFPFYAGSMEEDTLSQIINLFGWDYWNFYPNKGRIYTLHKKLQQPSCNLGG